jgi:hypothetical protein
MLAQRDIFVSRDEAFTSAGPTLLSKFAVRVLSLPDAVSEIKRTVAPPTVPVGPLTGSSV